jgi:fermentation-respiration switch protein FrsA (DUF1100 family)
VALSVPSELDSIANGQRVTAPAIFVLASADTFVTPPYQKKVVDAFAGEKREILVPDADHNDPMDAGAEKEFQAALDWIWSKTH